MTQLSHQATSLGGAGPGPPQLVVDYAIASRTAAPWVTRITVGDAWPMLSDHCPLMLSLALPAPLAFSGSSLATLHTYWEPGVQAHWRAHLSSLLFLACLQEATSCVNPQAEVAAVDALLLDACHEVGLTWTQRPHNPNQDRKHHPT